MPDWIIYYSDDDSTTSADGTWETALGWGVQIVAQPDSELGRRLHCRRDYYLLIDDKVIGLDIVGWLDYLINVLDLVTVYRPGAPTIYQVTATGKRFDLNGLTIHFEIQGLVKVGRMIPRQEFRRILAVATDDPRLPRKSAWDQEEPRDTRE